MDYSVFDWSAGRYRVYRDARPWPVMADTPPCRPTGRSYRGMFDINTSLCVLPADAKFVGASPTARGHIVRPANGMLGVPPRRGYRGAPNLGTFQAPPSGFGLVRPNPWENLGAISPDDVVQGGKDLAKNVVMFTLSGLLSGYLINRLSTKSG